MATTAAAAAAERVRGKLTSDIQDDYLGIVVGGAISKLYSMVMLQRMDQKAGQNNHLGG